MAKGNKLDQVFNFILRRLVESGVAPFYSEVAAELGVEVELGRQALHQLISSGVPAWLFPQTDYISSFAPFSNLPTQYRVSVDGVQKWFAQ